MQKNAEGNVMRLPDKAEMDRAYTQFLCHQTADSLFNLEWHFQVFAARMETFILDKKLEEAKKTG